MTYSFIQEIYSAEVANQLAQVIEHIPNTDPTNDPFSDLYNLRGTPISPPSAPGVALGCPKNYGILVYPGFRSLDVYAALEYLHFAPITFNICIISSTMDPVTSNIFVLDETPLLPGIPRVGQKIIPTHTLANAPSDIEVLIVPGAHRLPSYQAISGFIAQRYPQLRYLISCGTGSALVAQSGCVNQ